MTRRVGSFLWLAGMIGLAACGDAAGEGGAGGDDTSSTTSGTTTVTASGGGAPVCTGILIPEGIGDLHGSACIACIENSCCGALAACAGDSLCQACLGDPSMPGCTENAAVLDLVICAANGCDGSACVGITLVCNNDGTCDTGAMGGEQCSCSDCLVEPVDEDCTGAVCDLDGMCVLAEACTCGDCDADPSCQKCNVDGFCDTYHEWCGCADCESEPVCAGAGGGGGGN